MTKSLEQKLIEETYHVRAKTGKSVHIVMNPNFFQEFIKNNEIWLNSITSNIDGFYGRLAGINLYESNDVDGWEVREGITINDDEAYSLYLKTEELYKFGIDWANKCE